MLVFNIKLRSNKTSLNRRISAITTALFFRNVETKNLMSLYLGQKVYVQESIFKYYAVLSLRGRMVKTLQLKSNKGKL